MEDKEAKAIIESILFMSGEPVTLDSLRKIIEVDKYNTERLVEELISDYSIRAEGLMIVAVAGAYQMVTNPACAPWVKKLLSTAVPKKLSQSSLETIAIIAYKQPIIKAEIEAIRGVNSDGVVKTLLERRLIKILGRKEVPGRPLMYGTTNEFLQYFGLKELSELPTLKEFAEVDIPEPPENGAGEPAEQEQIEGAEKVSESAGHDLETLQEEVRQEMVQAEEETDAISENIGGNDAEETPEEEGRPQEV